MPEVSPVLALETDVSGRGPEPGIALCLSGGGYRAMLFHLGALWRLNELGYLSRLDRISSVSGGSITAAVLGSRWSRLSFDGHGVIRNFEEVITPIRALAVRTIDVWAALRGMLGPGTIVDQVVRAYQRHLFGDATLQDLPNRPRFVINATNLQSGVLWRFMKPYMRDYRVGEVRRPTVLLAVAVAASAAFPPFLSPVVLRLQEADYTLGSGMDLQQPSYLTRVVLTDGGVYDNLGLETAWKRYQTVLVSNAGGKMQALSSPGVGWIRQPIRVLSVIDNQVRSLRSQQVVNSLKNGTRKGAYWGIRTPINEYRAPSLLPCPLEKTSELANVATRLGKLGGALQERLINWGYAVADAAIRSYLDMNLAPPTAFPYPATGV
ncbi:MAG: patatin-like phospholipase family protein [bacterium]